MKVEIKKMSKNLEEGHQSSFLVNTEHGSHYRLPEAEAVVSGTSVGNEVSPVNGEVEPIWEKVGKAVSDAEEMPHVVAAKIKEQQRSEREKAAAARNEVNQALQAEVDRARAIVEHRGPLKYEDEVDQLLAARLDGPRRRR